MPRERELAVHHRLLYSMKCTPDAEIAYLQRNLIKFLLQSIVRDV